MRVEGILNRAVCVVCVCRVVVCEREKSNVWDWAFCYTQEGINIILPYV